MLRARENKISTKAPARGPAKKAPAKKAPAKKAPAKKAPAKKAPAKKAPAGAPAQKVMFPSGWENQNKWDKSYRPVQLDPHRTVERLCGQLKRNEFQTRHSDGSAPADRWIEWAILPEGFIPNVNVAQVFNHKGYYGGPLGDTARDLTCALWWDENHSAIVAVDEKDRMWKPAVIEHGSQGALSLQEWKDGQCQRMCMVNVDPATLKPTTNKICDIVRHPDREGLFINDTEHVCKLTRVLGTGDTRAMRRVVDSLHYDMKFVFNVCDEHHGDEDMVPRFECTECQKLASKDESDDEWVNDLD
jgi:hypothetical protein